MNVVFGNELDARRHTYTTRLEPLIQRRYSISACERRAFELAASCPDTLFSVLPTLGPIDLIRNYVTRLNDPRLVVKTRTQWYVCNLNSNKRNGIDLRTNNNWLLPINRSLIVQCIEESVTINYKQTAHYHNSQIVPWPNSIVTIEYENSAFTLTYHGIHYVNPLESNIHRLESGLYIVNPPINWTHTYMLQVAPITKEFRFNTLIPRRPVSCNDAEDRFIYLANSCKYYQPRTQLLLFDSRTNPNLVSLPSPPDTCTRPYSLQCYNNGNSLLLCTTGSDSLWHYDIRAGRWLLPYKHNRLWRQLNNPTFAFIIDN